jgi:hypothetical protein
VYGRLLTFFSKYGKFDPAPVYILVFSKPYDTPLFSQAIHLARESFLENIARESVWTSSAMAMQNLLLSAEYYGVSTRVKDGVKFMCHDTMLMDEFYEIFGVPESYSLIS